MGERACRWSGKRSGQSLGQQTVRRPRDRRAASSRLHARAAARASLATHSTLAFYVAGAATAVCSRQLCGGVAHFGSAERQRAVVELRKVGCKCPNAMTFIPHSRNKYLMSVFRSRSHSALTGVCTAHQDPIARRRYSRAARFCVQGHANGRRTKARRGAAVWRHHPPHSVEKPECRLPDALDASCSSTCVPYLHLLGACGSSPLAGPVAARALPEIRGSSPVRPPPGPPLRLQRCWLSCMLPHLRSQRLRHHSSWCLACTTRARRSCPT